jgi:hypothetical protein
MSNEHPGMITFVNEEMKTEEIVNISEFPEDKHFVNGIPVVKVVFIPMDGNRAKICEFGPGDRLLQVHDGTVED